MPACPSCGVVLSKALARKTKCPHCGEVIYVKATPDDPVKRLMNKTQADEAERLWGQHSESQRITREAGQYGLDEAAVRAAYVHRYYDLPAALRDLLFDRAMAGDRTAALGMIVNSEARGERLAWQRCLVEIDLSQSAGSNFAQVQIHGGDPKSCAACARLNGKVIPVTTSASEIIPDDCARISDESRCLCFLMTSPAIEREDGSTYFVRN